jgi:hypothetical protein
MIDRFGVVALAANPGSVSYCRYVTIAILPLCNYRKAETPGLSSSRQIVILCARHGMGRDCLQGVRILIDQIWVLADFCTPGFGVL